MKRLIACVTIALAAQSLAQQRAPAPAATPSEPGTAIERLQLTHGRMIVRGAQKIGDVSGSLSTSLSVEAVELRDATSKQRGVAIETAQRDRSERKGSSFVDRDEMDALIVAAESMLKMGDGVTALHTYEVSYKTRGGFELSMFTQSKSGSPTFSFAAGRTLKTFAFSDDRVAVEKLIGLLKEARTVLDSLK